MGFGTNGITITSTNHSPNAAGGGASLAIQPDGKTIVVGNAQDTSGNYYVNLIRYNLDGSLDQSFGTNGIIVQYVPNAISSNIVTASKLLLDSSGNIFVFGNCDAFIGNSFGETGFALKFNSNGILDNNFGVSGSAFISTSGAFRYIYDALQLSDGSFLFSGQKLDNGNAQTALGKLNADGTLASTFGSSGVVTWGPGVAASLLVDGSGKILVGWGGLGQGTVSRFTANGVLDSSFGSNGSTSLSGTQVFKLLLQNDGNLIVVQVDQDSNHDNNFRTIVSRLTSSGAIDQSFGTSTNGATIIALSNNGTYPADAKLLSDGSVLIAGREDVYPNQDALLLKLDSSGALTSGFGSGGIKRFDLGSSSDSISSLAVRNDGSILVAGSTYNYPTSNEVKVALAQFLSNGAIDDGTPPTIAITSNRSNLTAGETATITFALSESTTNFVAADITASGGVISNFTGSNSTYTATFTPTANNTANGVVRVASGKFSDASGNQNTDGSDANNLVTLTIDTRPQSVSNSTPAVPICFLKGTNILTTKGWVPVEALSRNQELVGMNIHANVKWIGYQRRTSVFAQFADYLPVKICAGALGDNLPIRDLYLSPDHAVLVDGHLIHANALVNGKSILQITERNGDIEYFHIETENHEIIFAEGVPCETFIDNVIREHFDNYAEYQALYPLTQMMCELQFPRVKFQRQMPSAIRNRLVNRADLMMKVLDQA